jgi:hypothetical protein
VPGDVPSWPTVNQQTMRWMQAGCFEAIIHDLLQLLPEAQGRATEPTGTMFHSRAVQSSPESGARPGYDGYKRKKGANIHTALGTMGHPLAQSVTPANEHHRAQAAALAEAAREATGESVVSANYERRTFASAGSLGGVRHRPDGH